MEHSLDVVETISSSAQTYVNFGMAVVVILVGLVGYYQKMRSKREKASFVQLNDMGLIKPLEKLGIGLGEAIEWLKKIHSNTEQSNINEKIMIDFEMEKRRQSELKRADYEGFRRGQDAQLTQIRQSSERVEHEVRRRGVSPPLRGGLDDETDS